MLATLVAVVRKIDEASTGSAPSFLSTSGITAPQAPLTMQLPIIARNTTTASMSAFGRCFLCKSDVVNRRAYAVCSECDDAHEVRASWAHDYGSIEAQHEKSGRRDCFCPGWLWMNEQDDGSFNIERCDTCGTVRDDSNAARDVVVRCCIRGVDWRAF